MTRAAIQPYLPFVVAALWAIVSAQLFVRGWIAAAELVIVVIAVLRGRMPRNRAIDGIAQALAMGFACSVLISLGFGLVVALFSFNRHGVEEIVYWACAVTFASTFARRAPARIRKFWDTAMTPPPPAGPSPVPEGPPAPPPPPLVP
ncbi:MAG TPA: hypothetical protein VMV21_19895 [Vicinamibacteria bacterium]|nr:hypothetical protein [Vicinamibacteria bacterium]